MAVAILSFKCYDSFLSATIVLYLVDTIVNMYSVCESHECCKKGYVGIPTLYIMLATSTQNVPMSLITQTLRQLLFILPS